MADKAVPSASPEPETKVSIDEAFAKFNAALRETREKLDTAEQEILDLSGEIHRTKSAPPHADDITAAFVRGLDSASQTFKQQLGLHLSPANAGAMDAAKIVAAGKGQMLTVDRENGSSGNRKLLPSTLFNVSGEALSVAAMTYFLRDRIAVEIPKLVAELCPGSVRGMKQADRLEKLGTLEAKLADVTKRRDELKSVLAAAQAAVYRRD